MLFLKMYPGSENPFFLSIGSLKMTSCSNRKIRLSLARDKKPLSCSVTVKVSCCSSLPWAVIFPWYHSEDKQNKPRKRLRFDFPGLNSWHEKCFEDFEAWSKFLRRTSKPCSLPTFIMSLQRFGTKHITSTAFCLEDKREFVTETKKHGFAHSLNLIFMNQEDTHLQLLCVHPSFGVILQEVLLK